MELTEALPLLMFLALGLLLFTGYPVAFVLGGIGIGFALLGFSLDLFPMARFNIIPSRIFGSVMESPILTAIPMFIFMGTMLEKSGAARDLLTCIPILLRGVPGSLALSVTLMGTILAATTGIIGASVVMMSLLALPIMLRDGYSHGLATGTVAASGTLGILIPPSIMLVIMADLLSRSVGTLFFAALLPGLLLTSLYMVYIVTTAIFRPDSAPMPKNLDVPDRFWKYVVMLLRSFLPPIFLVVLVLGSILAGFATPTEAAGVGAAGAVLLSLFNLVFLPSLNIDSSERTLADADDLPVNHVFADRLRVSWRGFSSIVSGVVQRSALTGAMIFGIFIGATIFSYVFRALGGEDVVIAAIERLGLGSWGMLILILSLVFLLGFFFDWVEITLIVLPVFAPIVELLDFGDHLAKTEVVYWFAILMAVNLQTSFLTPPFGFALFYMKAVAPPEVPITSIYLGIIPFVLLQLTGLGLVMAFPGIALWLPREFLG